MQASEDPLTIETSDMNILCRSRALQIFGIVCLGAAFSACQSSGSRFAEQSQETMILDTIGNGTGRTPPGVEGSGTPEGVGRWGGNVYYIRNGQGTVLTQRERFAQGVTYEGRGRMVLANGTLVSIQEGELVTFAGEHIPVPPGTIFSDATPTALKRVAQSR